MGTTKTTTQEMLNQVNQAISNILVGGQSYKIGSRQLTRADLSRLYEMRTDLQAQISDTPDGLLDNCYVAMFDGR